MENTQYLFLDTKWHTLLNGLKFANKLFENSPCICTTIGSAHPVTLPALKTSLVTRNLLALFYPHLKHLGKCEPCRDMWDVTYINQITATAYTGFDFCNIFDTTVQEDKSLFLGFCGVKESELTSSHKFVHDSSFIYMGWDTDARLTMDVFKTHTSFHEQVLAICSVLAASEDPQNPAAVNTWPFRPSVVEGFLRLAVVDGTLPWIRGIEEFVNFYNHTICKNKQGQAGTWTEKRANALGKIPALAYLNPGTLTQLHAFQNPLETLVSWKNYHFILRRQDKVTGELEYKINKLYIDVYNLIRACSTAKLLINMSNTGL